MDQQTTFTGKTVEEAIKKGLQQLGLTKNEVKIDILNKGRKGFLHVGSKDAIVRITKISARENSNYSQNEKPLIKGKVWVKDGIIHCSDPEEGELIVHIPPNVLFYKNKELVKDQTTVSEKDQLEIDYEHEETPTKWKIEISKDKLTARLKVIPGKKTIYSLRDQNPVREITLKLDKTVEPNLTMTKEDVFNQIKQLGLVDDYLLTNEIEKACATTEEAEFIIAKGKPPVEGKNGWIEYLVEVEKEKKFVEDEDGSINYREGTHIPSVDKNTEIAVIHNPTEGKAGRAVTGEVIPPQTVYPLQIHAGNGVVFQNQKIVSTSVGRPSIIIKGYNVMVDVIPKFEHQGDVNLASGNVRFNGDVFIHGNVEENMEVSTSGNIVIKGMTSQAKIKAGQSSIHYSNVISSEIIAGNSDKIMMEKSEEIKEIYEKLVLVQADLNEIRHNPSFTSMKTIDSILPLFRAVIQKKYADTEQKVRTFISSLKHDQELLNASWQAMLQQLHAIFIMQDSRALPSFEKLDQLITEMKRNVELSTKQPEEGVVVEMPSAMNSTIYSSGDVIINRKGCYNCDIVAQGKLEVKGFIRGGKVFAGRGAVIDGVGSKGGSQTIIIVPKDQTIEIKHAYYDTIIQIGKKKYTFTKDMTTIMAHLDENGEIALR